MENKYVNDFEFQSKIQLALSGAMSKAEKQALILSVTRDKYAIEEYIFSQKLNIALHNQDAFAVSAIVGKIIGEEGLPDTNEKDDLPEEYQIARDTPPQFLTPKNTSYNYKTWLIGIVAVFIVGLGIYSVVKTRNLQKTNIQSIIQKHVVPMENDLFTDTPKPGLENLEEGMKAYDAKDYNRAIVFLDKYYQQTKDANAGLYYAISMLIKGDMLDAAEQTFRDIIPQLPPLVAESAEWYLVLTLLNKGKIEEAIVLLEKLKQNDSVYGNKAKELLLDLK